MSINDGKHYKWWNPQQSQLIIQLQFTKIHNTVNNNVRYEAMHFTDIFVLVLGKNKKIQYFKKESL